MDSSYKATVEEIKEHLVSIERKTGLKLLFAAIVGAVLITLVVIYLILRFRSPDLTDDYYDFEETDEDSFPFDENEEEEDDDLEDEEL